MYKELTKLIQAEVKVWGGEENDPWDERYKGVSNITKMLLGYWFEEAHFLSNNEIFDFYLCQRNAIETLIYIHEILEVDNVTDLYIRFAKKHALMAKYIPRPDNLSKYCFKMATGSGKTFIMILAIVWNYFNAILSENVQESRFSKNFLIIAPNLIVLDRLAGDIRSLNDPESLFNKFPFIPPDLRDDFKVDFYYQTENISSEDGFILVTNVQQLYPKEEKNKPIAKASMFFSEDYQITKQELEEKIEHSNLLVKTLQDLDNLLVINDEAHHVHEEALWFQIIQSLNQKMNINHNRKLVQLDFSATPRQISDQSRFFEHIIFDYPLELAIRDNIVKKPVIGNLVNVQEVISDSFGEKKRFQIEAGIKIREEYEENLEKLGKNSILFIVANNNRNADSVKEYIEVRFPKYKNAILLIHTYEKGSQKGEIKDLERLRKEAREIDKSRKYKIIVSVMMLKEGWDVKNVVTIVPLRTFDSQILVEQTLGRGLRKMFSHLVIENLTVIEHVKFKALHESLKNENLDDLVSLVEIDPNNLEALTSGQIVINADKPQFNFEIPVLLGGFFQSDLRQDQFNVEELPSNQLNIDDIIVKDIKYYEQEFGDDKIIREMIMKFQFYNNINTYTVVLAKSIQRKTKINPSFPLWSIIKEYMKNNLFNRQIDFNDEEIIKRINHPLVYKTIYELFSEKISKLTQVEKQYEYTKNSFPLMKIQPFSTAKQVENLRKTVLNFTPYDSELEIEFARMVDNDEKIVAFCKIVPQMKFFIYYFSQSGFLKRYIPDFFIKTKEDFFYLVELKGELYAEMISTKLKRQAAKKWCITASEVSEKEWKYLYITETMFQKFRGLTFEKFVEFVLKEGEAEEE